MANLIPSWLTIFYVAAALLFVSFVGRGYRVRSRVNQLRKMDLPMPKWNPIFGHLLVLKKYMSKFPTDTFISVVITEIARDLGGVDMFYLDLWPFLTPTVFVCSSEAAFQVSNKLDLPKPSLYRDMFEPINGGPNLLTMNGRQWKYWRSLFNMGFAPSYLMEQVPAIVDAVEVFCNQLRKREGTIFPLQDVTTPLTIDVIMKVALDLDLNYQTQPHPLAQSLLTMIAWSSLGSPFAKYSPIRALVLYYHGKIMNKIIGKELHDRFEENQKALQANKQRRSKSIISLTLEDYVKEERNGKSRAGRLDDHFASFATYQLRLFLFAGHDTVTSVLVYVYHLLYKHSDALERIRQEHADVFGKDALESASQLRKNPALLNQTPYTLAVIKESMRLFPPAGSLRNGSPTTPLVDRHGAQYPTNDFLVSLSHHSIHRNPNTWVRAEEFLPERWMVEPSHELYPPADAFRPFELGPRMCIGQNLSLIELRITLIMTLRTLTIEPAYQEWDKKQSKSLFGGIAESLGFCQDVKKEVDGERAYQAEKGGAHPSDGYPCTVRVN